MGESDEVEEQVKALSESELAQFLDALPDEWRLFFEFLVQTGMRVSEAIQLRWSDVDLEKRTLRVRRRFYKGKVAPPKSKYGRRQLRLSLAPARALWPKSQRAARDELVFVAAKGGRIDQSNLMSRVLKPATVEVGLGEWVRNGRTQHAES